MVSRVSFVPDRLRILFAIGSMGGGGSERQMVTLLKHLDRTQFVPFLYLISREGPLLAEVPDDVPVFAFRDRCPPPRWNYPGRIHRMQGRDMAEVVREQKIDLIYDRTFQMTLVSAAASRRSSVRRVSVVVSHPRFDLERNAHRFVGFKRRLLRRAYREADQVVAVSEGVRQALLDYHRLSPAQVTTVYNPLDLERVDRLAAEREPPFEPGRFHVVCAGRLQEEKGYLYLLRAAEELVNRRGRRELLVHILGEGRLEAELKSFVQEKRLEDAVRFEGFQANPLCHLKHAHLVCLPSLYEGMPNVLLEALACGTPVVASDCPSGPGEILAGGRYGRLVPPADPAALADAIEDALTRYAPWEAVAAEARASIAETFSLPAGLAKTEAVLWKAATGRERFPNAT